MNKNKARILLLGPALHAVSGVSTHLNQLFGSDLSEDFDLRHFQVGSQGRAEGPAARALRALSSAPSLLLRLLLERPSVVHINASMDPKSFWRDAVYVLVGRLARRRILYQVHGGFLESFMARNARRAGVIRWLLALPDVIVVLSDQERRAYQARVAPRALELIPNAIELGEYDGCAPKDFAASPLELIYVGRLAADKGVQDCIEAMAMLKGRGALPPLRLAVVGDGPYARELRTRADELGMSDFIRFVEPAFGSDKTALWCGAHLFLFPTFHEEGIPYAVLESLAAGTPLVTTRMGGIPDVVREGQECVFVEPHAPAQLADAIAGLVGEPERLRQMSSNCGRRAREAYGIEHMIARFRDLYGRLAGGVDRRA